jgi:hypothetical protein
VDLFHQPRHIPQQIDPIPLVCDGGTAGVR